jgi:hypothetical protein
MFFPIGAGATRLVYQNRFHYFLLSLNLSRAGKYNKRRFK